MASSKLFISYSWSNPTHEMWVLDLATVLRESGVNVILDKWDLKERYDAYAFMEKMVSDTDIEKVAIICDRIYTDKADDRAGGVGTETQIISKEVYDNQEQGKFVAIVCEKDESGNPFLPAYYRSRIYIDLSEPDSFSENFEKLLRWIFNKPLYLKPEIGEVPAFITDPNAVSLGTSANFRRGIDAVKSNNPTASGTIDEYFKTFGHNLERFRIENSEGEFDDLVVKNIEEFMPYRNEAIQLFITLAQYSPTEDNMLKLHKFLESMIPYLYRPREVTRWTE